MDSDEEMMLNLFMEVEATSYEDEHITILSCLLQLQAEDEKATLKHGGSKFGQKNSKPRHRMEGHAMLYTDYFVDDSTYNAKDFNGDIR
jgi:isoprenylcysteine carboxyl methyltransferase (ICMT) family protein YpbQ